MKFQLKTTTDFTESDLVILPVFKSDDDLKYTSVWTKELKTFFGELKLAKGFKASSGETVLFNSIEGHNLLALGLGEKKSFKPERKKTKYYCNW